MFDRLVTPIIALGLGFLVWVYIRSRDQDYYEREIPLTLQVAPSQAEQFALASSEPVQIPVAFSGPPSRIREVQALFRQGALRLHHVVNVPEEKAKDSRDAVVSVNVRLDAGTLPVPTGMRAEIPELKKTLTVNLLRIVEVKLPVRLNSLGGAQVERVTFEPSAVVVRGPKEILDKETSIPTELYVPRPVDVEKGELLVPPFPLRLATRLGEKPVQVTPAVVKASLLLKGPQRVHELTDVPVHFLAPTQFPHRPRFTSDRASSINLKVRGPNTEAKPNVTAYVDLTVRKFGAGLHADEPIKVLLPPGYTLLTEPLPRVSIQLEPLDTAFPRDSAGGP